MFTFHFSKKKLINHLIFRRLNNDAIANLSFFRVYTYIVHLNGGHL